MELPAENRREITEATPVNSSEQLEDEAVEERLEALGYAE
jgi:hypothetical protein